MDNFKSFNLKTIIYYNTYESVQCYKFRVTSLSNWRISNTGPGVPNLTVLFLHFIFRMYKNIFVESGLIEA